MYTEQEKSAARKLQATLANIDAGHKVPFNITVFTNKGLVFSRKIHKKYMGKDVVVGHTWHLTPKGKQFLNVVI